MVEKWKSLVSGFLIDRDQENVLAKLLNHREICDKCCIYIFLRNNMIEHYDTLDLYS